MYTSYPMYECFGYIDGVWLKGFECGTRAEDDLICFIPNGSREKYWLAKECIDYQDGC